MTAEEKKDLRKRAECAVCGVWVAGRGITVHPVAHFLGLSGDLCPGAGKPAAHWYEYEDEKP